MPRKPSEYKQMDLFDREIKDLYDGYASRLCDELSLMTKYDNFVNRPHDLGEYYDFILELEAISRSRDEALELYFEKQEWRREAGFDEKEGR